MGINSYGVVLIESKVETVFATDGQASPRRRAARVNKAVEQALRQLGGAVRNLRSGRTIYRATGEPIPITPDDKRLVQAIVLLLTSIVVLMNIITDLTYAFIDPRVRVQ